MQVLHASDVQIKVMRLTSVRTIHQLTCDGGAWRGQRARADDDKDEGTRVYCKYDVRLHGTNDLYTYTPHNYRWRCTL